MLHRSGNKLTVEQLEDRLTPSSASPLWPDALHLTLSFVPDRTDVGGSSSQLFAMLNAQAPTAAWETVILQAFQTWAGNSNINIGVVPDGGQPLGSIGDVQGDPRFGDIRVAAKLLPAGTVATTAPFSWTGTTWSGDLVFNSLYNFGIGGAGQYDLFTVAMHEAGHVFGFGDETTDPTSVMYENYTGPRTGLSPQDIANLQGLYGARELDAFNTSKPDNSFGSAAVVANSNGGVFTQVADLTSAGQSEYYKFTTPTGFLFTGFSFGALASGLSLVVPSVTIYNAAGEQVASAVAGSPLSNNVTISLSAARGATYYAKVTAAAGTVFGIGAYELEIANQYLFIAPPQLQLALPYSYVENLDSNWSIGSAVDLTNARTNMTTAPSSFLYRETINLGIDRDFFKIQAPVETAVSAYTLSAVAWGAGLLGFDPIVHAYTAAGTPIAVQVLANSSGTYSIQVANTTPGAVYYIEVDPLNPGLLSNLLSDYTIFANFNTAAPVALAALAGNTLSQSFARDTGSLVISNDELFHFVLASSSANANMSVTMTVTDQNGNTVLTLNAGANAPPSTAVVLLKAGTYSVTYTAQAQNSGQVAPIDFWLLGEVLSDPTGPYYTGNSGTKGGGGYAYTGPSSSNTPPKYY